MLVGLKLAAAVSLAGLLGEPGAAAEAPPIVVLDFAGGEVHYTPGSPSDPDARSTPFSECAGFWPPYGDRVREAEILDLVQSLFADFDVVVTEQAPDEGPYLRAIVGMFSGCGSGVGYAERSCERTIGHGVVFAKFDADDDRAVLKQAAVIAHELGHAFGLAHVDNPDDIMHPTVGDGHKTFVDTCNPPSRQQSGDSCQLAGQCARGQNSWFGLASVLGPARADDLDPAMDAHGCVWAAGGRKSPIAFSLSIVAGFRRRACI